MAKLRGPLLSGSASGTLGDHLAYYGDGKAAYARSNANRRALRRAGIKLPPTPAQQLVRDRWTAGITAWHALTSGERATYNEAADAFAITGFNLFMQQFNYTPPPVWVDGSFGPLTFDGTAGTTLQDYSAHLIPLPFNAEDAILDGNGHAVGEGYAGATYYHDTTPGSPNYRVQARTLCPNAYTYSGGPMLRHDSTVATAYVLYFDASDQTWRLTRYIAGATTILDSTQAMPPNGNRLLAIQGDGDAITAYIDGTLMLQATDSAIQAANHPAFAPFGPGAYAPLDDFQMIDTPPP
jgi:hypothetical protein